MDRGGNAIHNLNICTEIKSVALWISYMSVGNDQLASGK